MKWDLGKENKNIKKVIIIADCIEEKLCIPDSGENNKLLRKWQKYIDFQIETH